MTITCGDLDEFLDAIAGLIKRGLGFKARAQYLEITLTGAF